MAKKPIQDPQNQSKACKPGRRLPPKRTSRSTSFLRHPSVRVPDDDLTKSCHISRAMTCIGRRTALSNTRMEDLSRCTRYFVPLNTKRVRTTPPKAEGRKAKQRTVHAHQPQITSGTRLVQSLLEQPEFPKQEPSCVLARLNIDFGLVSMCLGLAVARSSR